MTSRALKLLLSAALVSVASSGAMAGPTAAVGEAIEQGAKSLDELKALKNLDDLKVLNNLDELEALKNVDDLKALNNLDELEALKNVDDLKNLDDVKNLNNLDDIKALDNLDDGKILGNVDDLKNKPVQYDKFLPTDEAVLDNANPHSKQFGKLPENPDPHAKQFGKLPEAPGNKIPGANRPLPDAPGGKVGGGNRPLPPTPDEGAASATKLKSVGEIQYGNLPDAANAQTAPKNSPFRVQNELGDLVGAPKDAPGRFTPNKVSKNIGALPKTPTTAPKLTKVVKITPLSAPAVLDVAEPVMGPLKVANKSAATMKKIAIGATASIIGLTAVSISTPYVVRAVTKEKKPEE